MKDKKQNYERVEAGPGPAFSISENDWEKLQEKFNVQKTEKELKKYESFFKKIRNKTNVRTSEKERNI